MTEDNGVLCWFYVYNKNDKGQTAICGIIIIKQLTDSNVTEDKIFFYAETKTEYKSEDTYTKWYEYDNDTLIKQFIDTIPNYESIRKFDENYSENNNYFIAYYSTLYKFLKYVIEKNFKQLFVNADDKSIETNSSWDSSLFQR